MTSTSAGDIPMAPVKAVAIASSTASALRDARISATSASVTVESDRGSSGTTVAAT